MGFSNFFHTPGNVSVALNFFLLLRFIMKYYEIDDTPITKMRRAALVSCQLAVVHLILLLMSLLLIPISTTTPTRTFGAGAGAGAVGVGAAEHEQPEKLAKTLMQPEKLTLMARLRTAQAQAKEQFQAIDADAETETKAAEKGPSSSNGNGIKRYTVFGERNSGTNFLESIISKNFHLNITWDYGYKHFFGWNEYHRNESIYWATQVRIPAGFSYHRMSNNSDDVLFFGIVRSPIQWLGSMYSKPWHLPHANKKDWDAFLTREFYSIYDMHDKYWFGKEILSDHHIYLNRRYTNILESRATKCIFFLDDMPKRVKHFMLIRYEDLIDPIMAKSIFHEIAKKVWNTDYPNIDENHYTQAISHNTNSLHRTSKRDHNSQDQDHANQPKTKLYSLPSDALSLIDKYLNKTVELRMGYMV